MRQDFDSRYRVEREGDRFVVALEECGCIASITENGGYFGLGERECAGKRRNRGSARD